MAYADQKASGSRIVAITIVALIHVALGYAFVTGLAYQYVKKVSEKLNTFDVAPPPAAAAGYSAATAAARSEADAAAGGFSAADRVQSKSGARGDNDGADAAA